MHTVKTAKISSKGQVTLPAAFRATLKSSHVRMVADGDVLRIEPVKELAGRLRAYAKPEKSFAQEREQAWAKAMRDKHARR